MPRIQRKASSAQQSAHVHSQQRTFTANSAHSQPTAHFHSQQRTFTANSAHSQRTAHFHSQQRTFTANSAHSQPSAYLLQQRSRRLSCALKRCNDVGGRLRDAGELFNKRGESSCTSCAACSAACERTTVKIFKPFTPARVAGEQKNSKKGRREACA